MTTTCPVCTEATLANSELEANLQVNQCSKCNGVWITAEQYENWLLQNHENLPEKSPDPDINLVSAETPGARFCPDCKSMLVKYKVGHDVHFSLNRCGSCGGIWFDKNEWEILKSRNLHDDVHLIFSQAWQTKVRQDESKEAMDEIWHNLLGDSDWKEIQRIKGWIQAHAKSAELYAYLRPDCDKHL